MNEYIAFLSERIPEKDSLKIVKAEAKKYFEGHTVKECYKIYPLLYDSDNFQIQEVGVLLAGYAADVFPEALRFLHDIVSQHESWKVQEILAMAFDHYCAKIGYEAALPVIEKWFTDTNAKRLMHELCKCPHWRQNSPRLHSLLFSLNANIRRAASEGLRIWTSRPYFRDHPEAAIALLASHKEDESEYVRKSAGNALRDICKKFPELIRQELGTWDLSSKRIQQVYKLASKFLSVS